jgi:PRTRC genetic system protein A
MTLIDYQFAISPDVPIESGKAITYIVDALGTYAQAKRPGLDVRIPISVHQQPIKGLAILEPYLRLEPLVPETILDEMWAQSCLATPNEILFHLLLVNGAWQLHIPDQIQTVGTCEPIQKGIGSTTHQTLIEIHSHGAIGAFFSQTDDADEESGFRIYGVMGNVRNAPEIMLRVGLFGHAWHIPPGLIFDLKSECLLADRTVQQPFYQIGAIAR